MAPIPQCLLVLVIAVAACGADGLHPVGARSCSGAVQGRTGGVSTVSAPSQVFGLRLAKELATADRGDNLLLSPVSAQLALAMAATGARSTTQRAILDTLGLAGLDATKGVGQVSSLIEDLTSGGCGAIEMADSLWSRQDVHISPGYLEAIRSLFRGQTASVDFDSPKTPAIINRWVSKATHGRIHSIIDDVIPGEIFLYLINATYFHGEWQHPFDAAGTRNGSFQKADGRTVTVPLMTRSGEFEYGEGPDFQAVSLPYSGGSLRMLVVLPRATLPLAGFSPYLDESRFEQIVGSLNSGRDGELRLPRFTIDHDVRLEGPLADMGMAPALSAGSADFSGISPDCEDLRCYISEVRQKTFLRVDEKGTTAVAATEVGAGMVRGMTLFRMVVNRPFLAAIQDTRTGTLLFLGMVGVPLSEG